MDKEGLISELRANLEGFFKERSLDLVDIIYRYEGGDLFLRILADKPEGGITIGECASINRDIAAMLDEKDFIKDRYILEVSSPGLDRPLASERDFLRSINKKLKFFLNELINGKLEWDGVVSKVDGNIVYVNTGESVIEVPLDKINKAKQII